MSRSFYEVVLGVAEMLNGQNQRAESIQSLQSPEEPYHLVIVFVHYAIEIQMSQRRHARPRPLIETRLEA